MPVQIKLKEKYRKVQDGHYRGGHNMQGGKSRRKTGIRPVLPGERVMRVLENGKSRMEWR